MVKKERATPDEPPRYEKNTLRWHFLATGKNR